MSNNPILDEVYAARERIWAACGGTLEGLCAHYAQRRPGVAYADLKPVKPRRPHTPTRARPSRTSSRKKAVRP